MKIFVPQFHDRHFPKKDYSDGIPPFDHLEVPARITEVLKGISSVIPVEVVHVEEFSSEGVYQIHDHEYIRFLLEMEKILEPGQEYIPTLFRENLTHTPLAFRGGMYCNEIGTSFGNGSIQAALNSAATVEQAAHYLVQTEGSVFSLCRPPGHHAGIRRYGGYCFFNNAYIAAQILSQQGSCAVLDIDYHLGDGSMEFASSQIPYFSLHADHSMSYPYLNIPSSSLPDYISLTSLPSGIKGEKYCAFLESIGKEIQEKNPDYLVISLGFDTLGTDYIQDENLLLVSLDYQRIAQILQAFGPKLLILFEGGYDMENLFSCAAYFAKGLSS